MQCFGTSMDSTLSTSSPEGAAGFERTLLPI